MAGFVIDRHTRPVGRALSVWRTARRLPLIPIFILGGVVILGIFANLIAPHDPADANLRERNLPPFWGARNCGKVGGGST